MAIRYDEYNGVRVLTVDGELAGENSAAVRQFAEDRLGSERLSHVVVDLEKSRFIDSDGLDSLLLLKRRSEAGKGCVKLAGTDSNCQKILEITRLSHRFESYPDLPAALKTMR